MIRPDTVEHLELCTHQLLREAKLRCRTIQKTKMMLVNMFDCNNEAFWRRVYEEKLLDRDAGLNYDEGEE